ncbi:FAD-dependent oxidoreductase [Paenibacillus allorhizosphaerae]|uniref:FAD-dependent oxidoreductase n=1 Tax=Paenibacillus allorhizosphaerae TaxID=2849866 RepID=UPI00360A0800
MPATGPYDIPYRCLLPKRIQNLLAGGRCISTTHEALATTRLSPSCMATGQAAGTAAGLAIRHNMSPQELDVSVLQRQLRADGALLD